MDDAWWVAPAQLNDEQRGILDIPIDQSHLLLGPPGSGKTNLLLLRANYMALSGMPNLEVIAYTRTLQEFIAAGSKRYSFPISKVKTLIRWANDFLQQHGVRPDRNDSASFAEQKVALLNRVAEVARDKGIVGSYDALLLDEAQDYLPEEVQLFRRLGNVLFAVADSRQKIYRGADSLTELERACTHTSRLRFHYRNGPAICRLADRLLKGVGSDPMAPSCNYDEALGESKTEVVRGKSVAEQADLIVRTLLVQLKAYPKTMLGVMCPRNEEARAIWSALDRGGLRDQAVLQIGGDHAPFDSSRPICVTTMHSGKGLEFRALHLGGLDYLANFSSFQQNMAFTAITRAKTSLTLYYCNSVPGFLEKALAEEPGDPVPVERAFGLKK